MSRYYSTTAVVLTILIVPLFLAGAVSGDWEWKLAVSVMLVLLALNLTALQIACRREDRLQQARAILEVHRWR